MNTTKVYDLWEVTVQVDRKPFSFEKKKLLAVVDSETARVIWEKGLKHPHIGENIMWMTTAWEKHFGVAAFTFVYLENYQWSAS